MCEIQCLVFELYTSMVGGGQISHYSSIKRFFEQVSSCTTTWKECTLKFLTFIFCIGSCNALKIRLAIRLNYTSEIRLIHSVRMRQMFGRVTRQLNTRHLNTRQIAKRTHNHTTVKHMKSFKSNVIPKFKISIKMS